MFFGVFCRAQSFKAKVAYTRSGIENQINYAFQINYLDSSFINLAPDDSKQLDLSVFDRLEKGIKGKISDNFNYSAVYKNNKASQRIGTTSKIIEMHILDSVYITNASSHVRQLFYYDSKLNCTKLVDEVFDSTVIIWRPGAVTEFDYNSRNQIVKIKKRLWNHTLGRWTNYNSYIYDFDNKGRIILYEFHEGTSANNFSYKRLKYRFSYSNNYILQAKYYGLNEKWKQGDSTIFQFDTKDRLVKQEILVFHEDAGCFFKTVMAKFYYDSNDALTRAVQFKWNSASVSWKYDAQLEYIKTIQGFDFLDIFSRYYGAWKQENIVKYKVTSYGKHTYVERQHWSDASQAWENESREYFAYDSKHRESEYKVYIWDNYSNKWNLNSAYRVNYIISTNDSTTLYYGYEYGAYKPSSLIRVTTDSQVSLNQTVPSFVFSNKPINHKLLYEGTFYLNPDTTIGKPANESTYYYSTKDTGNADMSPQKNSFFKVYPNPSNDFIVFQFNDSKQNAELLLYDMRGRLIIKREVSSNEKITVKNISAGAYMYKVNFGNEEYRGKLVFY